MVRSSAESLLISSLVNSGDPYAARQYGVREEHFIGFRDEYNWLLDYSKQYGVCPSTETILVAFPEFPLTADESDPRWTAQEVQSNYAHRKLQSALVQASQLLADGQTKAAYAQFEGLRYSTVSEKPVNLLVDPGYLDDYTGTYEERIPVRYPTLSALTGGIGPGELWYLASRLGMGKSSILIDIAVGAACNGQRVLYYSMEMTKRQVQVRSHTIMGHRLGWGNLVDSQAMLLKMYDLELYKKLLAEIEEQTPGYMHIHDTSMGKVTPALLAGRCAEYDLVCVDYVGLMSTDGGNRAIEDWRHAAIISNELKEIALSKGTRILAAAQVNRDGDTVNWRPPGLKNLAQSDALGQDGDVVITMKRYGKDAAVFNLAKNRHGDSNRLFFTNFLPNVGNFTEVNREQADQIRDDSDLD